MTHADFLSLQTFLNSFLDWWTQYRNYMTMFTVFLAAALGFNTGYRR